jgi:tryptophan-rich sensory protein
MTTRRPIRWDAVIIAAVAAIVVAAVGGTLTDLGPWYQSLREPAWKPPDAAFGPIWTVIFACAVVSGVTGWQNEPTAAGRQRIVGLFAINGLLNLLWSLMFFQVKRPDLALVEVAALWLSILVLMVVLYRRSARASALLLPYLIWVSIASALNYEVVVLNGPFA